MKGEEQKNGEPAPTCPGEDRPEAEGITGGQTYLWMTEKSGTEAYQTGQGMLEQILSPANLNGAYKQVVSNKGSGGVDKMGVESLKDYLIANKEELLDSLLQGRYRPNPVRRVEIPKENGKKRQLGIPTVVDRMVQQSIMQVLSPVYEKQFSDSSYGFRPGRSAHQALRKCQEYITEGYVYAVDLDLEKFFDTVNQSKLIEVLSRTVKDGRVVSLVHKYLRAGVVVRNKYEETKEGVPQGGPLSPLLSNIMLNELDKELEKRGHRFVRYADDMVILCKSIRSAERTLTGIRGFIEKKLFLKVNMEKTVVAHISKIKFLGYSFYINKGEGRLGLHKKSATRMRERIKALTSRSNGWGDERRKEALKRYIIGWVNYFKLADMKKLLERVDMWYRRRLRMVIWKQWKRVRTRLRNLIKLGVKKHKAWEFANTRKGYWHTAKSPILQTSITNARLNQAGYIFLLDYYRLVKSLN
jgi:group II intron reverse transcriptase/maturase